MSIEKWIRRRFGELTEAHKEGRRLFDVGKSYASRFEIDKALEYFDLSCAIYNHPAPLINRAHIKMMRIRHFEAMQDLLEAKKLDAKLFGNEFAHEITPMLTKLEITTRLYKDGTRDKLIADLKQNGRGYVAKRILLTCFKVDSEQWEFAPRANPLMKFHFFNELDNIAKFESPGSYPEIETCIQLYPDSFVQEQVNSCPNPFDYMSAEVQLQAFLCCYEQQDMSNIRGDLLYWIHDALMTEDYGLAANSILSEEETYGIIRQAHSHLHLNDEG